MHSVNAVCCELSPRKKMAACLLEELPAELSRIVIQHLPYNALSRLALTNRQWAARVAPMYVEVQKSYVATRKLIAASTTFDDLEELGEL